MKNTCTGIGHYVVKADREEYVENAREEGRVNVDQHPQPPASTEFASNDASSMLIVPGIVLFVATPGLPFDLSDGLAQRSGLFIMFSTTSRNVSVTPTAVFALASMNKQFMRLAKAWPSAKVTCREYSWLPRQSSPRFVEH